MVDLVLICGVIFSFRYGRARAVRIGISRRRRTVMHHQKNGRQRRLLLIPRYLGALGPTTANAVDYIRLSYDESLRLPLLRSEI